jgi:hypothetical protein
MKELIATNNILKVYLDIFLKLDFVIEKIKNKLQIEAKRFINLNKLIITNFILNNIGIFNNYFNLIQIRMKDLCMDY